MKVGFLQSCDRESYVKLLEASSRSVIEYCRHFDCSYDCFVGLKRGAHPWHAALNRITILSDYLTLGQTGWIVYLDVDAYVADMSFDLPAYLRNMEAFALIAAPSGSASSEWWSINNGVFALNLDHPVGRSIIRGWKARLDAVSDEVLDREECWSQVIDDQTIMIETLQSIPNCERVVHIDREIFNWNRRFIRQHIRQVGSIDYRARRIRQLVDEVIGVMPDPDTAADRELASYAHREFVHGLYHALLLRDPDQVGLETVMRMLESGERSHLQELQACLRSDEFGSNAARFLRRYLDPHALASVREDLRVDA